jgi:hypothetical protein
MSDAFQKEVLEQLRENGSDITKPHHFEFYLYVPTRPNADKAAEKIRMSGFSSAAVSRATSGGGWLCLASKTIVPKQADLAQYARFMEQVATALGGEFDGWEAEIVEVQPRGHPASGCTCGPSRGRAAKRGSFTRAS